MKKLVYDFGGKKAQGNARMKNLLGGKGANLAEMTNLGIPVPPGFTITTDVCIHYYKQRGVISKKLKQDVKKSLRRVERLLGRKFGDPIKPLLVSVRSGARRSMPGMMETVLNIGLTKKTIPGLVKLSRDERFVYDAYRRLIMMYSDVVMEKAAGIEPKDEESAIRRQLETIMNQMKTSKGYKNDLDLNAQDLKELCDRFKTRIKLVLKEDFPDDHDAQLWGGIGAVFASWNGKRAVSYRRIEGIPDDWGTAVNVQAMVFGNMGDDSATGVGFTRNPGNGENKFYGEYLINAQGEDVVAGIRTPAPINEYSKSEHNKDLTTLQKAMPRNYKKLDAYQKRLEKHYKDMQDIEFTIEDGTLYMLQTRVGKRNGPAAVKMAMDMLKEKLISREEAVMRVTPQQLDELLHPMVDPQAEIAQKPIAKGLPAGPGGAAGQIVFSSNDAVEWTKQGKQVILVREETNPEDVEGMRSAQAILTARGGMTSHAALVARGWGKCCIVGCGALCINYERKEAEISGKVYKEGAWITLNGTKGNVYDGKLPMMESAEENVLLHKYLEICDSVRGLGVRANADTPDDAKRARSFGAQGIGLMRTEHMFYGKGSEEPLFRLRKMIVSKTQEERRRAVEELYPYVKKDIKGVLEAMDGLPVVMRLLDPPLHEFVPREKGKLEQLAKDLNISSEELIQRADALHESNPMMGHRGVRLGVTYPEITTMQVRAIFEAAAELIREGKDPYPEIMVPVVAEAKELESQKDIVIKIYQEVLAKYKLKKIKHMYGTMIEIPRACIVADQIAQTVEFFSYGTNDLTQMGFGFSRDDIGGFLPEYIKKGILPEDPFQSIDQAGIGELIKIGIARGRKTNPQLEIGICGEHGGEPRSVHFCHRVGMNYVSCSPFRVPIARLAAAQASILHREKRKVGKKIRKRRIRRK
ncbi:pyruvate phosphate dikinase [candidate division WOR_3 bacterium SM23_42]|uniref:Pyruvate, phosphate dikinase n=1 Tax=candidate division WOR_3 bacterium SM23_42 TaxID=1703779 RepID=A0A0S8FVD6_UNCW3|nr:MAG: pyruvate phosphate dikinase [candidate division WOR_3 bacterium SM23_42]